MKIHAIEKEYKSKTPEDFKPYLENEAKAAWESLCHINMHRHGDSYGPHS